MPPRTKLTAMSHQLAGSAPTDSLIFSCCKRSLAVAQHAQSNAPAKTSSTAFGHRPLSMVLKSISAPMDPNSNGMTCTASGKTQCEPEAFESTTGKLGHDGKAGCTVASSLLDYKVQTLGRARIIHSMASCASAVPPCSGAGPVDSSLGWPIRQRYAASMACPMHPCARQENEKAAPHN